MSHNALMKLAKINAHIQELETERKMIREKLNQTLLELINQNPFTDIDFETLLGGILFIQKTILIDDDVSNTQKLLWKKEGSSYQAARKKSIKTNVS